MTSFVRRRKLRRERGQKGSSALELMMTMSIVFFLLFSMVHVSLICCAKLLTNYSAWAAARVWAVNKDSAESKAQEAGVAILEIFQFGPINSSFVDVQEGNEGVEVNYETTLGIPFLLKNDAAGHITTKGWGAVPRDPRAFDEKGDNRER
jgi:hypothetical protein